MTISSVVHSVFSGSGLHGTAHRMGDPRDPGGVAESPEAAALRRCETYRRSVPTADLVLPGGVRGRRVLLDELVHEIGRAHV